MECDSLSDVLDRAEPGDVLLTSRPGWISALIRRLSDSDVSHAILVLPGQEVVMAHLPRTKEETVVQRYTYGQLMREEWIGMYCHRHQGLEDDSGALAQVLEIAEQFENDAKPGGQPKYNFATADLVMGAALCLIKPAASVIIYLNTFVNEIEESVRSLFKSQGGAAELYCSEFVYRCFLDASRLRPSAAIDTSMLILRDWAAIITGQQPLLQPNLDFDVRWAASTASWLEKPETQLVDRTIGQQVNVNELLRDMRDYVRRVGFPAYIVEIADFVTPVDLQRSPTFRAVAWWTGQS